MTDPLRADYRTLRVVSPGAIFLHGFHYFQGSFHGEAPLGDGYREQPGYAGETPTAIYERLLPGDRQGGDFLITIDVIIKSL